MAVHGSSHQCYLANAMSPTMPSHEYRLVNATSRECHLTIPPMPSRTKKPHIYALRLPRRVAPSGPLLRARGGTLRSERVRVLRGSSGPCTNRKHGQERARRECSAQMFSEKFSENFSDFANSPPRPFRARLVCISSKGEAGLLGHTPIPFFLRCSLFRMYILGVDETRQYA